MLLNLRDVNKCWVWISHLSISHMKKLTLRSPGWGYGYCHLSRRLGPLFSGRDDSIFGHFWRDDRHNNTKVSFWKLNEHWLKLNGDTQLQCLFILWFAGCPCETGRRSFCSCSGNTYKTDWWIMIFLCVRPWCQFISIQPAWIWNGHERPGKFLCNSQRRK